jgi:hypothetical protein
MLQRLTEDTEADLKYCFHFVRSPGKCSAFEATGLGSPRHEHDLRSFSLRCFLPNYSKLPVTP